MIKGLSGSYLAFDAKANELAAVERFKTRFGYPPASVLHDEAYLYLGPVKEEKPQLEPQPQRLEPGQMLPLFAFLQDVDATAEATVPELQDY